MRPLIVVFNGNSAPTGSMHTYKYVLYRCLRCDYLNKTHASRVCSTGVSLSGRTFEILFFLSGARDGCGSRNHGRRGREVPWVVPGNK